MDKLYEIICPVCKKKAWIRKSIFHDMGMLRHGSADCLGCKVKLNFIYDPEKESMTARNYEEFLKEIHAEKVKEVKQ
jgi:hypothetical protein